MFIITVYKDMLYLQTFLIIKKYDAGLMFKENSFINVIHMQMIMNIINEILLHIFFKAIHKSYTNFP